MNAHAKAAPVNKSRSNAHAATAGKAGANPVQKKENKTGLPDRLKAGLENLSNHSMDDVRVHYHSPKPAQLQAHAYSQGSDIHLAPGQEKHLPHEAWHVVQQKQGRVKPTMQLKGQVPVNDDAGLESEADRMGHRALSQTQAAPHSPKPATPTAKVAQCYHMQGYTPGFFMAQQERQTGNNKTTFLGTQKGKANIVVDQSSRLRVADTGKMAIEDSGKSREAKLFYGTKDIQASSNAVLREMNAPIRLGMNPSMQVRVKALDGRQNTLFAMYPLDLIDKKKGHDVEVPERCNEAAPHILNSKKDNLLRTKPGSTGWARNLQNKVTNHSTDFVLDQFMARKQKRELLNRQNNDRNNSMLPEGLYNWWNKDTLNQQNQTLNGYNQRINHPENETIHTIGNRFNQNPGGFIDAYAQGLNTKEGKRLLKEANMNQFIKPKVGEILSIRSVSLNQDRRQDGNDNYVLDRRTGEEIKNPFPYHYAAVIAKSGGDYIAMENYARRENDEEPSSKDPRFFFQMYGTQKKQTFHEEHQSQYPSAMTFVHGKQPKENGPVPEFDTDSPQFGQMQKQYNKKLNSLK